MSSFNINTYMVDEVKCTIKGKPTVSFDGKLYEYRISSFCEGISLKLYKAIKEGKCRFQLLGLVHSYGRGFPSETLCLYKKEDKNGYGYPVKMCTRKDFIERYVEIVDDVKEE